MRRLPAVMAMLATLAALAPASQAATAPATLAGRTDIVVPAGNVRMTVTLPRTVTFAPGYFEVPFVKVSGTADAAVAYLIPRTRPLLVEPAAFGRLPAAIGHGTVAGFPGGKSQLTAGLYDLVVVHTPGTATITLTFAGLPGRTTLRPVARSTARIAALSTAPVTGTTYAPVATTGGVAGLLAGTGFVTVAGGLRVQTGGATRIATCLKRPGDVVPAPLDFAPECPGLDSVGYVNVAGDRRYFATTFLNHAAGTYSAGYAYEGAVLPTASAGFATWVPLP